MKEIYDAVLEYCKLNHKIRGYFATSDGKFIMQCADMEAAEKTKLNFVFGLSNGQLTLM